MPLSRPTASNRAAHTVAACIGARPAGVGIELQNRQCNGTPLPAMTTKHGDYGA